MVKKPPAMWETWVRSLGWEDPLEEGMATHSSILAWRIPWTEEPGGLQSKGWQSRIRLSNLAQHSQDRLLVRYSRSEQSKELMSYGVELGHGWVCGVWSVEGLFFAGPALIGWLLGRWRGAGGMPVITAYRNRFKSFSGASLLSSGNQIFNPAFLRKRRTIFSGVC